MSTGPSQSMLTLPDILADWPWKRTVNPFSGLQAKSESSAWIQSFNALTPRLLRVLELGNNHLLSSLAYPLEDEGIGPMLRNTHLVTQCADVFRVGCDLMNWFFLFDEFTDVATPDEAHQMAAIAMDAVRNPDKERPSGECIIGEATRQFWKLSRQCASEGARRRFIEGLDTFTASVAVQAQDRARNYIRNVDEYFLVRRESIGARPSFAVLEFRFNLPDEVFQNPVVQRLVDVCVDLIIISNDLCSYNVEQARGDADHNLVTVLMHHENLDLNGAISWIADYASKIVHEFLDDLSHVPFFGEKYQDELNLYLWGIANWTRANDCWSFEGGRYFATGGLEIQRCRKVVLLPRVGRLAE